jgi:hypothetical protein
VHQLAFDILFSQVDRLLASVPGMPVCMGGYCGTSANRNCSRAASKSCTNASCIAPRRGYLHQRPRVSMFGVWHATYCLFKEKKGPAWGGCGVVDDAARYPRQVWSSGGGVGGLLAMPSFSLTQQNYITQVLYSAHWHPCAH